MRVLLVEDDEMIGLSLREALTRQGWSVDWVKDGVLAQSALADGDYACVLLDLPSREQLTHVACKMLDLLSEPVQIGERQLLLRPSIGIAMCPDDGDTTDELLEIAGAAMRRAGDQGNGYAFSDARAERWASQFADLAEA